jgi:hypothetical protein
LTIKEVKMKRKRPGKKLTLNKETVAHLETLGRKEQKEVKGADAAAYEPCWENLWTLYHCKVMYTGDPEDPEG